MGRMNPSEEDAHSHLVRLLGLPPATTWGEVLVEVLRLRTRVDRADAAARRWAARHPERVRELNRKAQERRRAKKGAA